ncbi:hypothetical protein [Candidatus Methylomicrobium oryzae]|jgi:hypothetical protein|uniref:hypothetical protein n=1 Tax=Candidatus Methylomicrobium oryzae TaxID=2802053 RepID=UPI001921E0AB|nr:hypothetical protein [Methylomicrobium sp. RS1]MBL1264804.1 hypothetical protein [Methylomicrobium sp. RS1]
MATKSDFSSAEWEVLRDTPHLVIFAVTVAGASGFFGSIAEALAPSSIINEALQGSNQLLREVCEREEIKSSIDAIKERARASGDFADIQAVLRQEAINKSRTAIEILRQKGSSDDISAYRDFLLHLGDKVANAATEGGFLGFGGERVSEHERTLLAELAEAVGMLQA